MTVDDYRDFLADAERFARSLHGLGVRSGDRVVIASEYAIEAFALLAACARIGAIFVPLNWRLTVAEQNQIIADCEPALFVTAHDVVQPAELALECPVIALDDLGREDELEMPPVPAHDQTLAIIYTAAVDGRPKGAMLSGSNLILSSLQFAQKIGLSSQDRLIGGLPVFHIFSFNLTISTILAGGAVLPIRRFEAETIADLIARHQGSLMGTFPPMLDRLLDCTDRFDLSGLRAVVGIEAPATIDRLKQLTKAAFWTGFGQTETSGFVTFAEANRMPGSAGFPAPLAQVGLLPPLGSERPGPGIGEIVVRGPLVTHGYWRRPDDTAMSRTDGWHRTGDLGSFDERGALIYKGRTQTKQLIKSGGENVYPAEVEAAMMAHPQIADCHVFGLPDAQWGEVVCAIYASSAPIDQADLEAFLSGQIARYKRPRRIHPVDSIPRDADGRVDQEKLASLFR